MTELTTLQTLRIRFPRSGVVRWLGRRPQRKVPPEAMDSLLLNPGDGIVGDHYAGRSGKRHVTLINASHLDVVADCLGLAAVDPGLVRRNVAVSGINLLALKACRFQLGSALLEYTDECHPCSRMEQVLGRGGYNAMRGHGGICARVLESGVVKLGDALTVVGCDGVAPG